MPAHATSAHAAAEAQHAQRTCRMVIMASQNRSSSALLSLSVGSIISVPAHMCESANGFYKVHYVFMFECVGLLLLPVGSIISVPARWENEMSLKDEVCV